MQRRRLNLSRREFLSHFPCTVGAAFLPAGLWNSAFAFSSISEPVGSPQFQLRPRYRNDRPIDATLLKVHPEFDRFPEEIYADRLDRILKRWSNRFAHSASDLSWICQDFTREFTGSSLAPIDSQLVRHQLGIDIYRSKFSDQGNLDGDSFLKQLQLSLQPLSKIEIAEFQITQIEVSAGKTPAQVEAHVRFEIVGTGSGFYREQRIGNWRLTWTSTNSVDLSLTHWRILDETRGRSSAPAYIDIASTAFSLAPSYGLQMLHGVDYWRTVLDGACDIDIYGHNGVSAADIDNDGFDDLYICQPAGLPNRLYRNRRDGTFEDITEASGLGVLENTACALFADFDNDGRQDVVVVRANGPLLFLNQGNGTFKLKPDAFQFTNPPRGTFTGAAVADYDRDGWLDIYFCLYSFYQGTGQYKYPSPYHEAENGPPNFLMRNNGNATFTDVTAQAGLDRNNTRYSFCCSWSDYNNDGWPDLYVVNDFGKKNLYRNNGDGTFTDVADELGVEDVGAGMSVSWLDTERKGTEDLYVANMWTALGIRVSMLDAFKKDSASGVRALYQKHAMGNSLLRNRTTRFDDTTAASGVGVGRWAWTSDAFDFDHDGFPDIYVVNGMVSGPKRYDLNSFFWRQVVAYSPDHAGSSPSYEQGWNAINELIRSDETWSGYERNVFYANNRDGTFSNISALAGLDFLEDGRSFALADFDHDGRQEILLKNRNAPQIRLLQNRLESLPPAISFRLKGTKSNRDAIGAKITINTSTGRQTRILQAGSGFLCQHSKDVFLALGEAKGTINVSVLWPSGLAQEFRDLPIDHRIWIEEGSASTHLEPFQPSSRLLPPAQLSAEPEAMPTQVETWLLSPVPAPGFSLPDLSGKTYALSGLQGRPVLLSFWTAHSADCRALVEVLNKHCQRWASQGLQTLTFHVDQVSVEDPPRNSETTPVLEKFLGNRRLSLPVCRASDDVTAIYNILFRQLYDRHRDMPLPTTLLVDGGGLVVKIYQGAIVPDQIERDLASIPTTDLQRVAKALPFPSERHSLEFGRNQLSLGALFFQRGYLDQAEVSFQQALREDPSSAEALYGIGSVYLNQNKNADARATFERCIQLKPDYPGTLPDAWNNLGVLATRENKIDEAITCFERALTINPNHLLSLDNLGNAYRGQKRWDEALRVLERAVGVAPDDAEANYSLGMVFAQKNDTERAYVHLQRALNVRPVYPEALNNLGILYLVTNRRDHAVASFEKCIQVAPAFDQAYLNLARLYAIEGARDKARTVLLQLEKQHPDHPQAERMLDQLGH